VLSQASMFSGTLGRPAKIDRRDDPCSILGQGSHHRGDTTTMVTHQDRGFGSSQVLNLISGLSRRKRGLFKGVSILAGMQATVSTGKRKLEVAPVTGPWSE
jgi:hypothetical protein